jgi:hypothetical protein
VPASLLFSQVIELLPHMSFTDKTIEEPNGNAFLILY